MRDMTGYSVCYSAERIWIEPHFCRTPDCGGRLTLDEACEMVARHFEAEAKAVREHKHVMLCDFVDEDGKEWQESK